MKLIKGKAFSAHLLRVRPINEQLEKLWTPLASTSKLNLWGWKEKEDYSEDEVKD